MGRRRGLEAWLMIYEILDQSSHAACGAGIAAEAEVVAILADRFVAFAWQEVPFGRHMAKQSARIGQTGSARRDV